MKNKFDIKKILELEESEILISPEIKIKKHLYAYIIKHWEAPIVDLACISPSFPNNNLDVIVIGSFADSKFIPHKSPAVKENMMLYLTPSYLSVIPQMIDIEKMKYKQIYP